ncbi:hypothetical protein [Oricola nitratireducens]|uniref:hypothetical protein n=1 Tax=Oricola nitratireducens TaxID=2775868 RepID=UPI00186783B5|nr:hypothetical protein [Oricola nitratireducens]
MTRILKTTLVCLGVFGIAAPASAQMSEKAWDFKNQTNRAAIASLIYQVDNGQMDGSSAAGTGSANACGGGGTSTATGNYTCIIVNNSTAMIDALQDSTGDQTSTADSDVAVSTSGDESGLSSVLKDLTD